MKSEKPKYEIREGLNSLPVNPEHTNIAIAKNSLNRIRNEAWKYELCSKPRDGLYNLSRKELDELVLQLITNGYGNTDMIQEALNNRKG